MKSKPNTFTMGCLFAMAALLTLGAVNRPGSTHPITTVRSLENRIAVLEDRLSKVEQRLDRLQSRPHFLPHPTPPKPAATNWPPPLKLMPALPDVPKSLDPSPKIWGQGEYRGWPYYILPADTKDQ